MKLMQSLMSDGTLTEGKVSTLSASDVARWKKRKAEIDHAISTLEKAFMKDSALAMVMKNLGADMGTIKACAAATSNLVDEWEELEMNVGMTIQNSEED